MHILIFLWQPDHSVVRELRAVDLVIAADSGLRTALRWGHTPSLVVGDLDSVNDVELQSVGNVQRFPPEKDATDFELAVDAALSAHATSITVVGSMYGRADHAISVMLGLASGYLKDISVDAFVDESYVQVVRSAARFSKINGTTVSLVPAHGEVSGVTTDGLRYPLVDATLFAGSTRPISNELTGEVAAVSIASGALLAIQSDLQSFATIGE
jgi:thiamine pyrophosphokinase